MLNKMYGTIKWYDSNKQYGIIIGFDDINYFFSLNNVVNKKTTFKTNDTVLFLPLFEENIPKAIDVEKDKA